MSSSNGGFTRATHHTLLSKKVFLSGLFLGLVCVAGSLVYHETVRRDVREQETRTQRFLKQLETHKAARAARHTETNEADGLGQEKSYFVSDNASKITSESAEVLPTDDLDFIEIDEDLFAGKISATDDEVVSPYGVSPYGFGPYPEVPIDFPEHLMPVWTWSEEKLQEQAGGLKNFELMGRVLVKLWNQGAREFVGVVRSNEDGKVYPIYPNTVYVKRWKEIRLENGEFFRYPSGTISGPGVPSLNPIDYIKMGHLPSDVRYLDKDTEGINPYDFLDLK